MLKTSVLLLSPMTLRTVLQSIPQISIPMEQIIRLSMYLQKERFLL
nr:MAG TPA: hypothetical protein [Bacteriophage sp.]